MFSVQAMHSAASNRVKKENIMDLFSRVLNNASDYV